MVLAIAASVLCAYIAPAAAGSGIPEVKAYLNGIDAHSILAPSTLFVKVSNKLKLKLSLSLSLYIYIHIYKILALVFVLAICMSLPRCTL